MKRTSKALIAAFVCAFAVTFTGCGNSADSNSSGADSSLSNSVSSSVSSADGGSAENPQSGGESSSTSSADFSGDAFSALWESAKYTEDTEIGEGAHNVLIDVKIGSKTVTITVRSDKNNLADMLTESGLAEGENGAYGLYIKKVNGILADYDIDQSYWGLNKDGAATAVGASEITVNDGERYELAYISMNEEQPAA
ncbi:MAG: DUF4430 domain-containing protein [Oscillospiraceae bacterium]|nr:DUF4430 domain-containing protein [Oscillospiraceae bacterium]